mgnify:FL=1
MIEELITELTKLKKKEQLLTDILKHWDKETMTFDVPVKWDTMKLTDDLKRKTPKSPRHVLNNKIFDCFGYDDEYVNWNELKKTVL